MKTPEKLEKSLQKTPEFSGDELKILQNLAADLDGLIFSRDENLDAPFKISLSSEKTKKVLRRGDA